LAEMECGAAVMASDKEDVIERCFESLRGQKVMLFLVMVNYGSLDRTDEIALSYTDVIIDLYRHEESGTGKPELARVRARVAGGWAIQVRTWTFKVVTVRSY